MLEHLDCLDHEVGHTFVVVAENEGLFRVIET